MSVYGADNFSVCIYRQVMLLFAFSQQMWWISFRFSLRKRRGIFLFGKYVELKHQRYFLVVKSCSFWFYGVRNDKYAKKPPTRNPKYAKSICTSKLCLHNCLMFYLCVDNQLFTCSPARGLLPIKNLGEDYMFF